MNILALDTSTESCSVALLTADGLLDRSKLMPREHAEHVLPMMQSLLDEAGLVRQQLDGIAVGRGPGAFTGVRLAISVAQGLAFALDLPVVTVSSLAALAMEAPADDKPVLAVIDARMGEIYAAAFRRTDAGLLDAIDTESVGKPEALVVPHEPLWNIVGTGWGAYPDIIAGKLAAAPHWVEAGHYPQARHVARLAAPEFAAGRGVAPEKALPVYLRNKVALTLRERGKPVPAGLID
ncbi:MAG TPA: tRNA (adenosine(37)-N6)-threonylcarbamoyltransferase complex dimerization subunit type 1 TsaB [Rhodanobacteraceae bacterium]